MVCHNDQVKVDNVYDFIKHAHIARPQLQPGLLGSRRHPGIMVACRLERVRLSWQPLSGNTALSQQSRRPGMLKP